MAIEIKMLTVTEQQANDVLEEFYLKIDEAFLGVDKPSTVGHEVTITLEVGMVGYDLQKRLNTTVKSLQARHKIYAVAITDKYNRQRPTDITDSIIN